MGKRRKKYNNRKLTGRFIALPFNMFESPNYKTLSNGARDVLSLFKHRFNGCNNGEIHLTAREIQKWYGFGISTAHSKLVELYERGFIKPNKFGHFTNKTGTTWILTFENFGSTPPTNEWRGYDEKQKKVPNIEPYSSLDRT